MSKHLLSEGDICAKFLSPVVETVGWNKLTQYLEEVSLTDGNIYVKRCLTSRGVKKTVMLERATVISSPIMIWSSLLENKIEKVANTKRWIK